MIERSQFGDALESEQLPKHAGNAAALASFIALSLSGDRPLSARVKPALVVRRHVRAALAELQEPKPKKKSKKRLVVVLLVVGGVVAAGIAMRRH